MLKNDWKLFIEFFCFSAPRKPDWDLKRDIAHKLGKTFFGLLSSTVRTIPNMFRNII
jgi:hypothetical protein